MIYQYDAERHRQVKLYILDGSADRYHRRVYISGDGVVKGYLNKPELTARKVPAEPVFALRKDVPDGRSRKDAAGWEYQVFRTDRQPGQNSQVSHRA
ncbi:hypothetical protein ACH95_13280 [Bacillus glycinifermentans]|uniref:Uncharacterized protein n=1 Tax=Bacillus glycinifermentans TaxID=1664069 RepID=A0A0J6HSX0_9BACI|nr:hypothetical protein [Bacillus glycinifermentans]ATH92287.1 hypothetical protein COP00_06330 [Bacillus glycinifermentans]KMM58592.1 hypothetical protein ACH95_13280 [Bacillus glycinifermentans]KRT95034.1 hypothetical protein AB447_210925 [Bacillus glycinifermentans]MEC0484807.1 hypothetical protein [Bacillus glycinifermentans]MEC0494532.1 hypothetical protein [Bacillus glycinifermentans]